MTSLKSLALSTLASLLLFATGCAHKQGPLIEPPATPEVDAPLNPGEWGLEPIDPKDYPDMRSAFADRAGLLQAIEKSQQWLRAKSSYRPFDGNGPITHDQIAATLDDMHTMLTNNTTPDQFQQRILSSYQMYRSKGYDRKGSVWFTAYYTPIFYGSPVQTAEYQYPIYKRPADLRSDPISGEILGRQLPSGQLVPYPTRSEIVSSGMLKGTELAWFKDKLEPYIIQVQGSAKIIMTDGSTLFVGYNGKNGRDYKGLGMQLVQDGKIDKKGLSLPAIVAYFKDHPGEEDTYINRNDSFAFLTAYTDPKDINEWPKGSLNVHVTPDRSLATDKSIFPRAALTFINTPKPDPSGNVTPYNGFLLDQDTGGAIRAAGRADIYMGIGPEAGARAGKEFAQGTLYYLFLKPGTYQEHPNLTPTPAPLTTTKPKKGKKAATGTVAPTTNNDELFPH